MALFTKKPSNVKEVATACCHPRKGIHSLDSDLSTFQLFFAQNNDTQILLCEFTYVNSRGMSRERRCVVLQFWNESCHRFKRGRGETTSTCLEHMQLTQSRHSHEHRNDSRHTSEWFMSYKQMSHISERYLNDSLGLWHLNDS